MSAIEKEGWGSATISGKVDKKAIGKIYKEEKKIKWESHPLNKNVQLGFLLTKKNDGVKITCLLARLPKGESIPEHTHKVHDILFPLSGKAKVWIKGLGDMDLKRGVLVSVPPETAHKVYDVTEDLEVYDIFSDAIL
jgi:quercetin dioxygenase-like cupin family protein